MRKEGTQANSSTAASTTTTTDSERPLLRPRRPPLLVLGRRRCRHHRRRRRRRAAAVKEGESQALCFDPKSIRACTYSTGDGSTCSGTKTKALFSSDPMMSWSSI